MGDSYRSIKDACASFQTALGRGTAYLVAPGLAVTCAHLLSEGSEGTKISLDFPAGKFQARVQLIDRRGDWALVELDRSIAVRPLPLAPAQTQTTKDDPWIAFGFPESLKDKGLLLEGEIARLSDDRIELFAANQIGELRLSGFSGSPVIVRGQVVGLLTSSSDTPMRLTARPIHDVEVRVHHLVSAEPTPPKPPDAPYDRRYYVNRRDDEALILHRLEHPGAPVVIQGPRWHGKGTLLRFILEEVNKPAKHRQLHIQTAVFNCQHVDSAAFKSFSDFLRWFAEWLVVEIELPDADERLSEAWARPGSAGNSLTWLLDRYVFPQSTLIYLALANVDRLEHWPHRTALFALLRSWMERRSKNWQRLRLLVTVGTEAALLEDVGRSSFFAMTPIVHLGFFDTGQLRRMAQLHYLETTDADIARLHDLVGGHPYLSRVAIFQAVLHKTTLTAVLDGAQDLTGGLYAAHLTRNLHWLQERNLYDRILEVLRTPRCQLKLEQYSQLYSRGLVVRDKPGSYRLSCKMYETYFRSLCQSL